MFTIIGADQKEYGPVSADDIRQWIKDGRADGRTLAKLEGTGEWKPLAAFTEFANLTAAAGAPPRIAPAYSNDPRTPVLALEPDFDLGGCLRRSRALLANNFSVLVGGTLVVWLIDLARYIPYVNLIHVFIEGVLYGGLYLLFLKRIRGQASKAGDVFSGFGVPFVQLLLVGFLTSLITGLAYLLCVFPSIYLKIAWTFSLALVIDKHLEFWTAMELSRRVATRVWFKLFALTVLVFAPYIFIEGFLNARLWLVLYPKFMALIGNGGFDVTKFLSIMPEFQKMVEETLRTRQFLTLAVIAEIILLINLPFALGALMYAYEALFGPRPAPAP